MARNITIGWKKNPAYRLGSGNLKLCIYNLEGKKVYEQNNLGVGDNHVSSGLKPGAYILKAGCGKYNFTLKLIVA